MEIKNKFYRNLRAFEIAYRMEPREYKLLMISRWNSFELTQETNQ